MAQRQKQPARYFYHALFAAVFAYVIVIVNAYTRISGGRTGCAAGYDCYDRRPAAQDVSEAAFAALPWSDGDSPWEVRVHPYLAAALAVVVVRLAYLGWLKGETTGNQHFVVPIVVFMLLLALVLPDIPALGLMLKPSAAMIQLLAALTILALLWWLAMREQRIFMSASAETAFTRALRPRAIAALVIVGAQIVLGAWSNVSHAGLPCTDFPTCHGSWWPPMDLAEGFTSLRYANADYAAGTLTPPAATAIHMFHRVGALIALLYVGWLAMHVFWEGVEDKLCRYGLLLILVLLGQITLGIMAVVMHLPIATALAHSALSALLLLSTVTLYHVARPPKPKKVRRRTAKQS